MSSYEQQELLPLTASSEAYPVNLTPLQDIDKAVRTIARYTPTLSDCFAKLDQNGQWLKTSQGYSQLTLDGSPEIYSEPLPKNGMLRGGKLYRVPSLGELIKEKESLLQQSEKNYLPTPTNSDCNTAGVKAHKKGQQKHLSVEVRNRRQGLEENSKPCRQLLPTPKHTDYKRLRDKSDNKMQSLPGAVNQLKNNKTKLLLNPEFTEKMMGFPDGWTDKQCDSPPQPELLQLDRLEDYLPLALCEEKPNHRIRLGQIGNAIVPQCAALMFDLVAIVLKSDHKAYPEGNRSSRPISFTHTSDRLLSGNKEVLNFFADCDANVSNLDIAADKLFPKVELSDSSKSDNLEKSTIVDGNISGLTELDNYKETIKSGTEGLKTFVETGQALIEIRDRSLYKLEGYKSFVAFCWDNFSLKKARIYQLIDATKLVMEFKKSTIVDANLSGLTESHCRELKKIKDKELRLQILKKIANSDIITSKAIASNYREMKLKEINSKYKPDLPEVGSVVRVTSKHDPLSKKYNGYWGIVQQKYEFTIDIVVLGAILSTVNPQDFVYLKDANSKFSEKLLIRLNKIYKQPNLNDVARGVLIAIATRPYPLLEEMDQCLLNCLEKSDRSFPEQFG